MQLKCVSPLLSAKVKRLWTLVVMDCISLGVFHVTHEELLYYTQEKGINRE